MNEKTERLTVVRLTVSNSKSGVCLCGELLQETATRERTCVLWTNNPDFVNELKKRFSCEVVLVKSARKVLDKLNKRD